MADPTQAGRRGAMAGLLGWVAVALGCVLLVAGPTSASSVEPPAGATGATAEWEPPANLSHLPGQSHQAAFAQNPVTGDLFPAWTEEGVAEREEIVGRRWDRALQAWIPTLDYPPENLSQSPWQDSGPALAFDGDGQGVLLWTRRYAQCMGAPADGTDLMARTWQGVAWSPEEVLFHSGTYYPGSLGFGLIPVETAESILLFVTWDVSYRTVEYRDGGWSEPGPWTLLDVALAQVVADGSGMLHAVGYGENSAQWGYNWCFRDAYYLSYSGEAWSLPLNLSDTRGVAQSVGLAFDREGRLHALWSDPDSPYSDESLKSAIWERVYDGAAWSENAEVTPYNDDQAIAEFSLVVDEEQTLHLTWSEGIMPGGVHTALDIYYQSSDGENWGEEQQVVATAEPSHYPLFTVGETGGSLVWEEGPIDETDLLYTRRAGSPPGPCEPIASVTMSGPAGGLLGDDVVLTALAGPLTTTLPITYTWEASEQAAVYHTGGGLLDMAVFRWLGAGVKSITVTAENCGGTATDSLEVMVTALPPVHLPLVWKQGQR